MKAELHVPYSDPDATPTPWRDAVEELERAGIYWVVSVRPTGRPHSTPVAGAWMDDAFYFATGPEERKAVNLRTNRNVLVITGANDFHSGTDVILDGEAIQVRESALVELVAKTLNAKYDDFFGYVARDAQLGHNRGDDQSRADVYEVRPHKGFAYARGGKVRATRYRAAR